MRDTRWEQVGDAVRARITELRLTNAEVQRRSGVSDKTLTGYLNGEPIRRADKARGLCEALGWTPDSIDRILDGDEPVVAGADGDLAARIDAFEKATDARFSSLEDQMAAMRDDLAAIRRHLTGEA